MVLLDQADGIGQDVLFGIDHTVGRQAALALAQAHRAARSMQAQPHLARRFDLIIQARAIGEQVKMIRGGGAARKGQLRQSRLGGDKDILRGHAGPDGIERLEPVEQVGVLGSRNGPGEGLVKMVVRIYQPGQNNMTAHIQHLVRCLRQFFGSAYLVNPSVFRVNPPARDFPALIIHRNKNCSISDQESGHKK